MTIYINSDAYFKDKNKNKNKHYLASLNKG